MSCEARFTAASARFRCPEIEKSGLPPALSLDISYPRLQEHLGVVGDAIGEVLPYLLLDVGFGLGILLEEPQ